MDFLEEKREYNNKLFRMYHHSKNNKRYLVELLNYNYDLIGYTIYKYFKELKFHKDIYEIGVVCMINAIENYEMDQIGAFEEYIIAYIKDGINIYNSELRLQFICETNSNSLNIGDIWYNKNHDLDETLATKCIRDNLVNRQYKKELKNKIENKFEN